MTTKEELLNYISIKLDTSEKWAFFSKEVIVDEVQICILSPSEEEALSVVMHWLRDKPNLWEPLKDTIEKFKK